jgi:hypothetical protein
VLPGWNPRPFLHPSLNPNGSRTQPSEGRTFESCIEQVPRLRQELVALFTTDTARRVLTETLLPLLTHWSAARRSSQASADAELTEPAEPTDAPSAAPACASIVGRGTPEAHHAALLAEAELDEYEDFDDYLEMVIQFGYVTLFASAFPLAGLLSLACNLVELYADGLKLTVLCRRPRPERASSIGGWGGCLYAIMLLSIYTNLFLASVASDQLAALAPSFFTVPAATKARKLAGILSAGAARDASVGEFDVKAGMGRYVLLLAVSVEHVLLALVLATEHWMVRPPAWVRLVLARRQYEAQQPERMHRRPESGNPAT